MIGDEDWDGDGSAPASPDDSGQDADEALLDRHVIQLMEHFDSVRIFVTRKEGKSVVACDAGAGNYYATLGQIREWMIRDDERTRQHERSFDEPSV